MEKEEGPIDRKQVSVRPVLGLWEIVALLGLIGIILWLISQRYNTTIVFMHNYSWKVWTHS